MGMWNWLGRKTFDLLGWKLVGNIPDDVKKCVIAVAPHTSIADFILGRLAYCYLDRNVRYLIKKEMRYEYEENNRYCGCFGVSCRMYQ